MNDMIISMEYKYYKEYECGSFKRNSSVVPFYLFISFFYFLYFCALIGSFYLSLICPLWDLLICPLWGSFILSSLGSFPQLRATVYILQEYQEDLHTLQEVINIKKTGKYHDVC